MPRSSSFSPRVGPGGGEGEQLYEGGGSPCDASGEIDRMEEVELGLG